ncbi:hypothetical protein [Halococcus sp. PRR34]|uniref:hypothetical protein n=1 Tax=Halococcus sp. PRR34 TaxID=3020830 RepID=UPI002361C50A|nr:hypothetical protein [Halococcus sp. PRR34]
MPTTDTDDGDSTDSKARANFMLSQAQKDKWDTHVEEDNEFSSLSQLIRQSVERELAGSHDTAGAGVDDEAREMLHELVDGHRKILSRIDGVDDRLQAVESAMSEPPEDVKELMGTVFDVLPEEHDVGPASEGVLEGDEVSIMNPPVTTGRVEHIADHLGEQTYKVRRAIEQLQEDSSLVESTTMDGHERYYRRA